MSTERSYHYPFVAHFKRISLKFFRSPIPRRLHMKFGFNRPSGFRGDVWKCWYTCTYTHIPTHDRAPFLQGETWTCFPQTDRLEIQCIIQAANNKGADQTAWIRRLICLLLFIYDKNRLSHGVAHFQINRSYLCRIRRKRVCCIQFYGENKIDLPYRGSYFAEEFALTRSICVTNGTMRRFV